MDYKRAYEELREVYLKDKQVADELAELVLFEIELRDIFVWLETCMLYDGSKASWLRNTNAFAETVGCSQKTTIALLKAVGKD
jgi:hypothetical protein